MDWISLIPAALSALGGFFGGGNKTTNSTSTSLTPQMADLAKTVLTQAKSNFTKPYAAYTGERVAGPTAARTALTPVLQQVGQQTMAGMNDANGYRARISQMMNQGPGRVTAPSLLGGPPGGFSRTPLPYTPVPETPQLPPVQALPAPGV
jgi:hypothetical protein